MVISGIAFGYRTLAGNPGDGVNHILVLLLLHLVLNLLCKLLNFAASSTEAFLRLPFNVVCFAFRFELRIADYLAHLILGLSLNLFAFAFDLIIIPHISSPIGIKRKV